MSDEVKDRTVGQTLRLVLGDCIEKMRDLPEGAVEAVICDPPYG